MKNQDNIAKQLNDITARLENLRLSNKRIGDEINAAIEEINNLQAVVEYTEESQEQRTSSVPRKEVKLDLQGFKRYNGHPVRILNTKRGEPNTGKVKTIGKLYVTVELPDGSTRRRIPKNLRILK